MDTFDVWVRPLGESCRLRVSGTRNAEWLLETLSESFSMGNAEPCHKDHEADICTFEMPCQAPQSCSQLEKALASLPEVRLMMRPE